MFWFEKFAKINFVQIFFVKSMNTNEKCLLKFLYNTKESFSQKEEEAFDYVKYDNIANLKFYAV